MKNLIKILLLSICIVALCACGDDSLVAPDSAESYKGKDYQKVLSSLESAGFIDIETSVLEDLTSKSKNKDGEVESVKIGDSDSFAKGDKFPPESKVLVTYHVIPKAVVPVSSSEVKSVESSELTKKFEEAGFTNIHHSEVYDLDPDEVTEEFISEVTINSSSNYKEGEEVAFDSAIKIITHYPFEKYNVTLHIHFVPNLLFNKYGVNVSIDGETIKSLGHGEDAEYVCRLKEGDYTIKFSSDSKDATGEVVLSVTSDVEAEYKIICFGDYIDVETVYVDYINNLANDEVKVMNTQSAYIYEDYKKVVKSLEDIGFTNISLVPVYDVYFGVWTKVGEVSEVTIEGRTDYKRGDVFKKDAEVKVTYHLSYEEDPEYIEEQKKEAEEEKRREEEEKAEAEKRKQEEAKKEEEKEAATPIPEATATPAPVINEPLTISNCSDLKAIMEGHDLTESQLSSFADKYSGKKIEFDGCVGYKENNEGILIFYGDYIDWYPVSGPQMTTWDTNTGTQRVAPGIDLSGYNEGDSIHVVVKIQPYKYGTNMYSVSLEEISHR